MLKYNIEDIKDKLKIINPNIEVLSPSYEGAHTKMKLKCLKDGYEWEACWNNLSNGTGCPKCANRPRYNIDMVKAELLTISPNIEILSTEYKNNSSHLQCRCRICGYEWLGTWKHLKRKVGCASCKKTKKLTLPEIQSFLKINQPTVVLLATNYINSRTPLECLCNVCGHQWSVAWDGIKGGSGCPKCARLNHPGFYSIKNAHRNKESFLKIPAILYVVEMEEDDQTFYKIGITTSNVSKRYQGRQVPYKYKILLETEMNLYRAILIEQTLVKQLKEQQYLPANKFPGHTECFICPVK